MIPKLICKIFGHVIREKEVTGFDSEHIIDMFGRPTILFRWKYWEKCPRCGVKL